MVLAHARIKSHAVRLRHSHVLLHTQRFSIFEKLPKLRNYKISHEKMDFWLLSKKNPRPTWHMVMALD